jgi:hypothetical protein
MSTRRPLGAAGVYIWRLLLLREKDRQCMDCDGDDV